MIKLGDMFGTELYYDSSKKGMLDFIYEENDEEFIYDIINERYIKESDDELTKEIIEDWLSEHADEIKNMISSNDFYYIKDLRY